MIECQTPKHSQLGICPFLPIPLPILRLLFSSFPPSDKCHSFAIFGECCQIPRNGLSKVHLAKNSGKITHESGLFWAFPGAMTFCRIWPKMTPTAEGKEMDGPGKVAKCTIWAEIYVGKYPKLIFGWNFRDSRSNQRCGTGDQ